MSTKETATTFIINGALDYVAYNPEKNLPNLLKLVDKIGWGEEYKSHKKILHEIFKNPENNWYKYIVSLWNDIDDEILKTIFQNFGLNASLYGSPIQEENKKKYGCNIPWAMLIDPTSACNLQCTGCWAAEYGDKLNMSYEQLDDIIKQGKALGTYVYLYSGGEPLVRKKDIIRLCDAHPDCQFAAFTNGTLIDEAFADEMLRVKNFIPAISVEGFEGETDFRRGEGTFAKTVEGMSILKEKKLPFGISSCYTSKNVETIGSEEYFDQMIEWGAKFCWFFTYMPVGKEAVPELMVSAEQRAFMYEQVRKFRDTKPLFTLDFWNDGEYAEGCIAGGKRYLHINANGDIEPCAFIHYSDSNIADKTILEALQSPLFMAYHDGQPFNNNHLRPCPLLDNPNSLVEMIEKSGAYSTDLQNPEDVHELSDKCMEKADEWALKADDLWACSSCCSECKSQYESNIA